MTCGKITMPHRLMQYCHIAGWQLLAFHVFGLVIEILLNNVCMYVCMYVRTYVCTYVCMYIRTYVRMYVCMYMYERLYPHNITYTKS